MDLVFIPHLQGIFCLISSFFPCFMELLSFFVITFYHFLDLLIIATLIITISNEILMLAKDLHKMRNPNIYLTKNLNIGSSVILNVN